MDDPQIKRTGGCLCGAVRYEATGEPRFSGHCYCADCRKATGSGFIPFMVYTASALRISGGTRQFRSPSFRGGEAVRNSCANCSALVFGGILGTDDTHTIYAGSLDDPSSFEPKIAIFTLGRPGWAPVPSDLIAYDRMPG